MPILINYLIDVKHSAQLIAEELQKAGFGNKNRKPLYIQRYSPPFHPEGKRIDCFLCEYEGTLKQATEKIKDIVTRIPNESEINICFISKIPVPKTYSIESSEVIIEEAEIF